MLGPQEERCIGEPMGLARRGDGSLHAEVSLPTSAVPPAVPAAEGQLLGFGSWGSPAAGEEGNAAKTVPCRLLLGQGCSLRSAGTRIKQSLHCLNALATSQNSFMKGYFSAFDKQETWWLVCSSSSAQRQEQEQSSAPKWLAGADSVTGQRDRAAWQGSVKGQWHRAL